MLPGLATGRVQRLPDPAKLRTQQHMVVLARRISGPAQFWDWHGGLIMPGDAQDRTSGRQQAGWAQAQVVFSGQPGQIADSVDEHALQTSAIE